MSYRLSVRYLLAAGCYLVISCCCLGIVEGKDETDLGRRASWSIPTREQIDDQINTWLSENSATEEVRGQVAKIWQEPAQEHPGEILDRTVSAIALLEPVARQLIVKCHAEHSGKSSLEFPPLPEKSSPWVRSTLRLYFGRWLVQNELYDEAIGQIAELSVQDVVDPGALLFYQAVCYHQLLDKTKFLSTAKRLFENKSQLPQRYLAVAKLMEADLEPVEADSLDEIQRLMGDIRRRLFLGRAGKRVRDQEDDVIAKLDKLIKKAEDEQQSRQNSAGAAGGASGAPSNPANDSVLPPGGAAGRVDPKKIGHSSGWGNLPPKQRQEALQRISRELPAHYREVIEEYFRKLARDKTP